MPLLRSRTRTRECMVTASTEMLAGGTISARFDQSSQLLHVALRYLNHSFVHLRASLLASKPALVSFAFAIRLHYLSTFRLRLGTSRKYAAITSIRPKEIPRRKNTTTGMFAT